jgi:hypothetical protein
MKPRKLTRASCAKIVREFELVSKVEALLLTHGAQHIGSIIDRPKRSWDAPYYAPAASRPWLVATRVGFLGVSPYPDWIACVFDDARAAAFIGANAYNGKWNHHSFVEIGDWRDRDSVRAALQATLDGFADGIARLRHG